MSLIKLSGPVKAPNSNIKPNKLIIFLHGVGADGNDLIGLAPEFAEIFPNSVFLSPNAPFEYDMYPAGYQWFSLQDRNENIMFEGIKNAIPILKEYIDENLDKYDLKYKDLILIGFSQGTMMALQLAPRLESPCHSVIGFSGAFLKPEILKQEIKSKPPILLIHGDLDQVIPVASHNVAVTSLKNIGLSVESHVLYNLAHSINMKAIDLAKNFIKNIGKV
ncbi:MAG: dienelactone hydrolase family protein [Rickettsiales bacterium]